MSEETEDVMVISCVLGSHGDSWLHEMGEDLDLIEENEPNTHVTDTHVMSHVIDSGASCCVINKQSLENFCHSELVGTGNAAFTAANGTPVLFCGRCEIVVKVRALDSTTGKVKPGVFKIPVMVGETPYNILSTYVLGKRGWKTVLTDSVSVVHEKSNVQMTEVMIWCDTPWVRVKPHHGSELILSHVEAGDNSVSGDIGHVNAVKRGNRDELEVHTCGSLVLARIRVKDELVPKIFVAKSLKLVFPIELDFESGMFVVLKLKGEEGPRALDFDRSLPSDVSRVLPSNQGVSLKCPPSGPPKEFMQALFEKDERLIFKRFEKICLLSKQISMKTSLWDFSSL